MTDLNDTQTRVLEILRKNGPQSVSGIARIDDPETKPDQVMVSLITYALKGLEERGLIKLNRTKRPFTAAVDPVGLSEYVGKSITCIADDFFRGDLNALVHFIDTNLSGGRRAKTKQTGTAG